MWCYKGTERRRATFLTTGFIAVTNANSCQIPFQKQNSTVRHKNSQHFLLHPFFLLRRSNSDPQQSLCKMYEHNSFVIDQAYEFSAPRFYDFVDEETEEETQKAEHWFHISRSYAPSRMSFSSSSSVTLFGFSVLCVCVI